MQTVENRAETNRKYYEANKQKFRERNNAFRKRNAEFVRNSKVGKPCVDCGIEYPHYVMEYDHVTDDKERNISEMVTNSSALAKIQSEIDKCELVCANCHRERTFSRMRL